MKRHSEKGFTLIELLIVVAIILIIAAIAIPNLIKAKMAANEASAVGSIHVLRDAAISYYSVYGNGFPPSLAAIGTTGAAIAGCNNAQFIDSTLTVGKKSGYTFQLVPGTALETTVPDGCVSAGSSDGFIVIATPQVVSTTGQRSFCSDASGLIKFDATGSAFSMVSALCSAGTGVLGQ
jgi:type IV pilus assembly protein PilA